MQGTYDDHSIQEHIASSKFEIGEGRLGIYRSETVTN